MNEAEVRRILDPGQNVELHHRCDYADDCLLCDLCEKVLAQAKVIDAARDLDSWLQNTGFWTDEDHDFLVTARRLHAELKALT